MTTVEWTTVTLMEISDVFDVDLTAAPDDVDTAKAPEFDQASHAQPWFQSRSIVTEGDVLRS